MNWPVNKINPMDAVSYETEAAPNNSRLKLFTVCLLSAYLLPFHFLPFSQFYNDWLAVLGITFILAQVIAGKESPMCLPWIAGIPLGLGVAIGIQVMLGMLTSGWDAALPIACLVIAALAIVLGATLGSTKSGAARLCKALVFAYLFAGMISVAIASLQFAAAEEILHPFVMAMEHERAIRPIANVAQPNQLALLFCFAIASVWWLYQTGAVGALLAGTATAALLWGLVLTQSRIGWIIIPAFALFVIYYSGRNSFRRVSLVFVFALTLLYFLAVLLLPEIAAKFGAATTPPAARVAEKSERLLFFQQAWHISSTYPWFGAGWREFGPQQIKIAPDFFPANYSSHAHNIVLNFAAELGWPVTLITFMMLGYWFFIVRIYRSPSREVAFATLIFFAVGIHSMVEFPLWYAYVLMPVALLIGMVHSQQMGAVKINVTRLASLSLLVVMLVGMLGVAMDYRRLVSGMWTAGWASIGVKIDVWSIEKPQFTVFPHFYDYFRANALSPEEGMSKEEIELIENVARRFGFRDVLSRLSMVYALNERPDDARRTLIKIKHLHPGYYPTIYEPWRLLAESNPHKFAEIFKELPLP